MERFKAKKLFLLQDDVPNGMKIEEGVTVRLLNAGGGYFLIQEGIKNAPQIFLDTKRWNALVSEGIMEEVK